MVHHTTFVYIGRDCLCTSLVYDFLRRYAATVCAACLRHDPPDQNEACFIVRREDVFAPLRS